MFRHLRFQTKLFLYFTIVVLIVITLSAISLYIYLSGENEKRAVENQYQLTLKASEQVDAFFDIIDRAALQIGVNPKCVDYFSRISDIADDQNYFSTDAIATKDIQETLLSIIGPKYWVNRVSLYNLNGDYVSLGGLSESDFTINEFLKSKDVEKTYSNMLRQKGSRLILLPHKDFWSGDRDEMIVSVVWSISNIYTKRVFGMVEVQQTYSKLEKIFDFSKSNEMKAYLFTDKGELFYPLAPDPDIKKLVTEYSKLFTELPEISKKTVNPDNHREELVSFYKSPASNWSVVTVQPVEHILAAGKLIGVIMSLIGFFLLILTLLIIFIITNRLTRPLRQLNSSVREVKLDNLSLVLDNTGNVDEVIQLNNAFNEMFIRLQNSMNQLVEAHSREVKANLLALQSQMDPHFLYNVLSAISSSAQEKGNYNVMEMCSKLSKMLRYITTYGEKSTTIGDEVGYVRNYLELMKNRFEDKFNYSINVDDIVLDIPVPKLILQPITENCFQHGFVGIKPPWEIVIHIYRTETSWFMEVCDNGQGMDEDKLTSLYEQAGRIADNPSDSLDDLKLGGLGLLNTYLRLKLKYDNDMIFVAGLNSPTGTKITIGGSIV